jgi:DHA3 family macrolide efflux protein-like MFS transporter
MLPGRHSIVTNKTRVFALIWLGQLVSLTGSGLTSFGLGVWVYQSTGSATLYALILFFSFVPRFLISPVAGALVDRWDRRRVMILGDAGAGLTTLAVWLLLVTGQLEIWHIYVAASLSAICGIFQGLAYYTSTTLLVPKEQFGRASGMIQLTRAVPDVVAPVLAGLLILTIGIEGVILIDVVTFVFAILSLQVVRVPQPDTSDAGQESRGSLLRDSVFGWTYLKSRPGLLGLLLYFAATNLPADILIVLVVPLVLSFTDSAALGTVVSTGGIGMVVGAMVMTVWGGPKRRMAGVYGFILLEAVASVVAGLRPSALLVGLGLATFYFCGQIIQGSANAIWQSKVEPGLQGRVFAVRPMLAYPTTCIAYLIAGPLADGLFEPLLAHHGPLAGSIGQVIGTGPGRGIGFLYVLLGLLTVLITLAAYAYPRLRLLEVELQDAVGD